MEPYGRRHAWSRREALVDVVTSPETAVPAKHPPTRVKALADDALRDLSPVFVTPHVARNEYQRRRPAAIC
jgi:hypothetical protein